MATISINLVGVHGYAYVSLCECGCVVGAVTGHGDKFALGLLTTNQVHLVFRFRLGEVVVHAGLARNSSCCHRVVACNHYSAYAHGPQLCEPLAHAAFYDVLEINHAQGPAVLRNHQWCAALARNLFDRSAYLHRHFIPTLGNVGGNCIGRAFAYAASVKLHSAHPRSC
jgi:hypothetical protein